MSNAHERVEKNVGLMIVLTLIAVSFGGLAEIVPLFWQKATTEPLETLEPYTALEMEGRDIYIREGCHVCHTQMVRPLRAETERYGLLSGRRRCLGAPLPVGLQAYRAGSGSCRSAADHRAMAP